jgi:hypothetical protein
MFYTEVLEIGRIAHVFRGKKTFGTLSKVILAMPIMAPQSHQTIPARTPLTFMALIKATVELTQSCGVTLMPGEACVG